ncbi:MAG: peptidoglycan-binding protein [Deltaproteobacteria bacterium]|nr:peptidoglycan-binding protein [Deltaproteobacteria bacterium]
MLSIGSRGSDVTRLQKALSAAGFASGSADGIFGAKTKTALTAFQRANDLSADGVCGPRTSNALRSYYSDGFDPGTTNSGAVSRTTPLTGSNHEKLMSALRTAESMGLRVTSYMGGRHAPNSYHYSGRAIDVAGSREAMSRFYRTMAQSNPTELFYDPMGGIKRGRSVGALGGHRDHVHIAF